jgi:hypothetical protein
VGRRRVFPQQLVIRSGEPLEKPEQIVLLRRQSTSSPGDADRAHPCFPRTGTANPVPGRSI